MCVHTKFLAFVALAAALACGATGQQNPTPERLPRDGFPMGPAAKILSFTVNPSTIQPGHSTTLEWVVVNADRITLDHDIGIVTTRGTRSITPAATTTYTLTALGYGTAGNDSQSVTVTVAGTTAAKAPTPSAETGEAIASKPIPRAADGRPDLSGVWIAAFMSIVPIDKVTLKPGAEKYKVGAEYGMDIGSRCLPPGVPDAIAQPYPEQIIQTPDLVVILYEAHHIFRVIPTDGRPHPSDLDPTWMGNSVGHWEGDTLVVDATGFNDKTAVGDYRHTTAYHVVERYRRTAYDTLKFEATIEDPNVFAAPWREAGTLTLHPEWYIQEYVCEENNHDYKALFEQYKK